MGWLFGPHWPDDLAFGLLWMAHNMHRVLYLVRPLGPKWGPAVSLPSTRLGLMVPIMGLSMLKPTNIKRGFRFLIHNHIAPETRN